MEPTVGSTITSQSLISQTVTPRRTSICQATLDICTFTPATGPSFPSKPLTSGNWKVTSVSKIGTKRGIVYYISTERESTERRLYSASLTNPGANKANLVDVKADIPLAETLLHLLTPPRPHRPRQQHTQNQTRRLQTNFKPRTGVELNALERLPANFNSKKNTPSSSTSTAARPKKPESNSAQSAGIHMSARTQSWNKWWNWG